MKNKNSTAPSRRPDLRLVNTKSAKSIPASTALELSIARYLVAMRQKNLSKRTIEAYRWNLNRLTKWMKERGVTQPDELVEDLLVEWGASLYDHWQPATVKQAISAARSWLNWCYEKRLINEELSTVLVTPSVKKRVQRTLWPDEIIKLLGGCDLNEPKGVRDVALVSLLVDSGLRAAEMCRLTIPEVDFIRRELKVVIKGGDEDRGYFGEKTLNRLEDWLAVRSAKPGVNELFTAVGGTRWNKSRQEYECARGYPLTVSGLLRILNNLGNSVGVPGVCTHSFRRTFVCLLTEAGANDGLIQKWGRWEDEKMVKLYRQAYQSGKLYNRYTPTDYLEGDDAREEA